MSCKVLDELEREQKHARDQFAQFAYKENAHLQIGMSKRQMAVERNRASDKMNEFGRQISAHVQNCKECQKKKS